MKKKIILVVIVVFAVAVSGVFVLTKCLKTNSNHEQVNVVEEKDEEFNLQEEEQSKDEITTETDENKNKTANGKSESPKEDTSKQENKSKTSTKVSETPKKAETKSSNVPTTSSKSQEEKQENKITESNKNNGSSNQGQQNKESTTFYDSITHGKKEFSSESEALRRGTEIQNKEWYNDNLLSLAGVYQPAKKIDESKIPLALNYYLNQNQNIKKIYLHFDNDSAGRIATMALKTVLPKQYEVIDDPPKIGKDFNDFLCAKVGINYKKRYEKER